MKDQTALAEIIAGTILIGASIIFLYEINDISYQSALFPRLILGLFAFLSALLIVSGFRKGLKSEELKKYFISVRSYLIIVTFIIVYSIAVGSLGYFSSTILLIPAVSLVFGLKRKRPIIIGTLTFVVLIFTVFVQLFNRPLPREFFLTFFHR